MQEKEKMFLSGKGFSYLGTPNHSSCQRNTSLPGRMVNRQYYSLLLFPDNYRQLPKNPRMHTESHPHKYPSTLQR